MKLDTTTIKEKVQTVINGMTVSTETKERLLSFLQVAQAVNANASTIQTQLTSRIESISTSSTVDDLNKLIGALNLLSSDRNVSVPTIGDLPTNAFAGSVFFVEIENAPYMWNGSSWVLVSPVFSIESAWAWGIGLSGRLGINTITDRSSPVSVVGGYTDWIQVSGGNTFSLGLRANGTAWAWGSNSSGQLGDNSATSKSSPVSVVGGFTDWIQVSGGNSNSLGLRANGTAWAWGFNSSGQLGDNSATARSSPVSVVGGFTDWIQVSAGNGFSLGLRANGTAWAWGFNSSGQLGTNNTTNRSSPVSVVGYTDWIQVSGGDAHSLGIRANGTAWAWGNNGSGRLGNNTATNRSSPVSVVGGFTDWIQVAAASFSSHSLGLRANGTAWAWGVGLSGRLGDNAAINRSSPVSVVGGFTDWIQVSAATDHSLGLRANGTAWAWGANAQGRLGDNTTTSRSSPVSVVGGFTDWIQVSGGANCSFAIRKEK
jgi:alpha-tubulin suppressor-like RCC1 family protein